MANINPLISFEEPITRQDLFDMWSTGSFSEVSTNDFAEGFIPVIIGSSFSNAPSTPQPGQFFWHQSENVMYCFHDEVDNTGVSLWLAIGPDKFECAAMAIEPIAVGAGLQLVGPDRRVRVARTASESTRNSVPTICGFNQSGINAPLPMTDSGEDAWDTAALGITFVNLSGDDSGATYFMGETAQSGDWIRMGIDGMLFMASAPGSHPSDLRSHWNTQGAVSPDSVFNGTVININSTQLPWNNMIGATIYYNEDTTTGTRSEPWWLTKCAFAPRMARNNYFNTP